MPSAGPEPFSRATGPVFPLPPPEVSPLCSAVPEAGVTSTTSGSLRLTPFSLHRLLCTGIWANARPQQTRAPSNPAVSEGATRGCHPAWLCHQPRATLTLFLKPPLHSPRLPLPVMTWVLRATPTFLPIAPSPKCEWHPARPLSAQGLSAADSMGKKQKGLMSRAEGACPRPVLAQCSSSERGPCSQPLGDDGFLFLFNSLLTFFKKDLCV